MRNDHKTRTTTPPSSAADTPLQLAWVVTAPYEVPACFGSDRVPWGEYHLRQDGALFTICGQPTANWISFWMLKPQPNDQAACEACHRSYFGHSKQEETWTQRAQDEPKKSCAA